MGRDVRATRRRSGARPCRHGAGQHHAPAGRVDPTPSIVLLFWEGPDRLRGQNLLAKLILTHATPAAGGKPVESLCLLAISPHAVVGFEKTTEANMLRAISNVAAHKVAFDTWWIDTGWFPCGTNWARHVGNPDPDLARFPRG